MERIEQTQTNVELHLDHSGLRPSSPSLQVVTGIQNFEVTYETSPFLPHLESIQGSSVELLFDPLECLPTSVMSLK
jgi:hypothetical protein